MSVGNAQDKKAEQQYYDELFLARRRFDQFPTEDLYRELATEARQGTSGNCALDLGCGSGTQSFHLIQQGFSVIAADLSVEATRLTKAGAQSKGLSVQVLRTDAEALPMADASFDACVCSNLLHHFKTLDRVAAELSRVVRPGGVVVAVDANAHNPFSYLFFNVIHRIRPFGHLTLNQRALHTREIRETFAKYGFTDFRFRSTTTQLKRDWLGASFLFTLNFYARAALLRLSNLLLPPLSRGNVLISVFKRANEHSVAASSSR